MSKAIRYIFTLCLFTAFVLPAMSCNAPPYYDNIKTVFPAVVRVAIDDRMGSGVIISRDGYIVTSQHVINTSKATTVLLNSGEVYEAPVVGSDITTDLAFIKLPQKEGGYPFAMLGNSTESDELQTGNPVLVTGYPAGNDINNLMLSTGVICAFRRIESVDYIQSNAKIYAGSSGGPMLNSQGEIIGIINSKYANIKDSCTTFATAINTAKDLFSLVKKGKPIGAQQASEPVSIEADISIKNVKSDNITSTSISISWQTSTPASSGVEIGQNDFSHFYSSAGGKPATTHNVQINGLEPHGFYHFRIIARNNGGGEGSSSIYELVTERAACAGVGCKAPGFSLQTTGGQTVSLSSFKGRKMILVFTSAGCSSCAEVVRCIQQIYHNWPRQQMEVIVIVSLEKAKDVDRWIKLYDIKTPVVLDPAGDITNLYQPAQMPAMYFLDGDGVIKIKKYLPLGGCGKEIDSMLRLY